MDRSGDNGKNSFCAGVDRAPRCQETETGDSGASPEETGIFPTTAEQYVMTRRRKDKETKEEVRQGKESGKSRLYLENGFCQRV